MSNVENPGPSGKSETKRKSADKLEPEEAFLSIPCSLRSAMKKHLPWVMTPNSCLKNTISVCTYVSTALNIGTYTPLAIGMYSYIFVT